jgi:Fe-S-cluster-containing dehydrogenase component
MKQWHLVIDVARCQGCNNCLMACRDEHAGNEWPGYSRPQSYGGGKWIELPCNERGQFPLIDVSYRPTLCSHCADAPCVVTSGGVIYKRQDGIVLIDPQRAAGRFDLQDACPYGMISWNDEYDVPQKCTLCAHLLDQGWAKPRCVQACGPGALSFVREDDAAFAERADREGIETLHAGSVTGTVVGYKNLDRFESCFIAGTVVVDQGGVVDCAAGAIATLYKTVAGFDTEATASVPGAGAQPGAAEADADSPLQTTVTDVFGDFKFDGLPEGSGEYIVCVTLAGRPAVERAVRLGVSTSLDTILVGGER